MKQSRARTQRGGRSTAVTYSLCDQTCVYSMECPPPVISILCVYGGRVVWETSVSLFYCECPMHWIQVVRLGGSTCWAKSLAPMFLSVPELWDTPLTSAFWHPYPFSFLILAAHGWSLWTVLSHAEFPRQGRVVTKRMGKRGLTLDRPYPSYGVT